MKNKYLIKSQDWNEASLEKAWDVIKKLAAKYDLDYYEPQFEIVTYEQMIEAYTHIGLPTYFNHWTLGKDYLETAHDYAHGNCGLAYEMIINSDPAVCYLLNTNTYLEQLVVMCHAAVGHSNFFKNNYLFKTFTNPKTIVDYMLYAKEFIANMENDDSYGVDGVELFLDNCFILSKYGVDSYLKAEKSYKDLVQDKKNYQEYIEKEKNGFWGAFTPYIDSLHEYTKDEVVPTDNILEFIEKYSPLLTPEERELMNIFRNIQQYFWCQSHTKVMNEGWASFWHYTLLTDLHKEGFIRDGEFLEALEMHTGVCCQQHQDTPIASGSINPYKIGFETFKALRRCCENPTEEDKQDFPHLAGTDWVKSLKEVANNFKDESFLRQYFPASVIKEMGIGVAYIEQKQSEWGSFVDGVITATAEDTDYVRKVMSNLYSFDYNFPRAYVKEYNPSMNKISVEVCLYDDKLLYSKDHYKDCLQEAINTFWSSDISSARYLYVKKESGMLDMEHINYWKKFNADEDI